ncbi:hypothetical protein LTR94_035947, partial [Friedmanniomyces endolithicus]
SSRAGRRTMQASPRATTCRARSATRSRSPPPARWTSCAPNSTSTTMTAPCWNWRRAPRSKATSCPCARSGCWSSANTRCQPTSSR